MADANGPSTRRGAEVTTTGNPDRSASARPESSVSTATAPASAATALNLAPCVWLPGSAAYRSPGRTARESWVTPVTETSTTGSDRSGGSVRPAMTVGTPLSDHGATRCGRSGAGGAGVCGVTAVEANCPLAGQDAPRVTADRAGNWVLACW